MKKLIKLSLVLGVVALTLTSCNCFKKMAKNSDDISLTCNPTMLTLNAGVVETDVHATFPAKYFNPKAIVKIVPVIVFAEGEMAGQPKYFQGSKVNDNYTVVDNKQGGEFTMHVEFPFDERMRVSQLDLRMEVKCKPDAEFQLVDAHTGKPVDMNDAAAVRASGLKVAEGVNTLQQDLMIADAMTPMPSNYKRITTEVNSTEIRYAINSAVVTNAALKAADLNAFKADVNTKKGNPRATQHLAVKGYASPDGPETLNDRLSKQRSQSGDRAIAKLLKGSGLDIDVAAYGEDWEGFQKLVRESNIKDKEMILQVLSMYSSSTQREAEIKNMSSVYNELRTEILPELRRSAIVNSTDIEGKTDAEMVALVNAGKLNELSLNELLYLAENARDNTVRTGLLEYAAATYNDARAYNNLGIQQMRNGNEAAALKSIEKASDLTSDPTITNNLALAHAANGDMETARQYARGADARTQSMVNALGGNYNEAARQLTGVNAAVANIQINDYTAAKRAIADDNSAHADYLRAVIAARQGDLSEAQAQLNTAVSKDSSLAAKARQDVHFAEMYRNGLL